MKLDPRPDTSRIFKVNYYLLEDLAIDRLMNYYYDTIVLFGEVERHIKRTKADKSILESFVAKQAAKGGDEPGKQVNYGVVFDSRGKLAISTLVEVGKPVCKGGAENCAAADIEGFMIRSNTGANWTPRKVGPKPEGDKVVPIEKNPAFRGGHEWVAGSGPHGAVQAAPKQHPSHPSASGCHSGRSWGTPSTKPPAGPICSPCSVLPVAGTGADPNRWP